MVVMIWQGMYGSGVQTGMESIITGTVHTEILKDRILALPEFFAVARGTISRGAYGVRIETGALQFSGTITLVFGLPVEGRDLYI